MKFTKCAFRGCRATVPSNGHGPPRFYCSPRCCKRAYLRRIGGRNGPRKSGLTAAQAAVTRGILSGLGRSGAPFDNNEPARGPSFSLPLRLLAMRP